MASQFHTTPTPKHRFPPSSCSSAILLLITTSVLNFITFPPFLTLTSAQSSLCRTSCGNIPIRYPFGIDDGCGSPYYSRVLACSSSQLELRTPSGRYPVRSIGYSDPQPHILASDPFMWSCRDGDRFRPTRPFSLDISTHLSVSSENDFLFFNCSQDNVIVGPKPVLCEQFPDRCDSSCDSASYLCRHLPGCDSSALGGTGLISCCSYYPRATESIRLMLKYCASYTSVYWRSNNNNNGKASPPDYYSSGDQAAEYGIRIDFDIPVTTLCLQCQDAAREGGGGTCGFDTQTHSFLCLCRNGNGTTSCKDIQEHHGRGGVIAGRQS